MAGLCLTSVWDLAKPRLEGQLERTPRLQKAGQCFPRQHGLRTLREAPARCLVPFSRGAPSVEQAGEKAAVWPPSPRTALSFVNCPTPAPAPAPHLL